MAYAVPRAPSEPGPTLRTSPEAAHPEVGERSTRQRDGRALVPGTVGALIELTSRADHVAAVTADLDKRAEPPGGVPDSPGRGGVVQVAAA
jgi:hypothetical protein